MTKKSPLYCIFVLCFAIVVPTHAGVMELGADIFKECAVDIITYIIKKKIDEPKKATAASSEEYKFHIRWQGSNGEYSGILSLGNNSGFIEMRMPNGTSFDQFLWVNKIDASNFVFSSGIPRIKGTQNACTECPFCSFRIFKRGDDWSVETWNNLDAPGIVHKVIVEN